MEYQNLIFNLDILSKIEKGDKLIIRNDILIININSFGRSFLRFNNEQGRQKTYLFLNKLFDELSLEIEKYINFVNGKSNLYANEINIKTIFEYEEIKKKIANSCLGIVNLRETYKKDKEICRKLELILSKKIFNI